MRIVKGRENVLRRATRSLKEAVAKRSITHPLMILTSALLRHTSLRRLQCENRLERYVFIATFAEVAKWGLPGLPFWVEQGEEVLLLHEPVVKQEKTRLKCGFGFRREISTWSYFTNVYAFFKLKSMSSNIHSGRSEIEDPDFWGWSSPLLG